MFINVERGDVVAEETIISALDNGIWSRAVPGVYEKEPLPPQSGLWSHPSVLLTPRTL